MVSFRNFAEFALAGAVVYGASFGYDRLYKPLTSSPQKVFAKTDIDEDGKLDRVIRLKNNDSYILLNRDGKYTSLEKLKQADLDEVNQAESDLLGKLWLTSFL